MNKPEVWMIAISGNPISMHYRNLVVDSWKQHGHVVNHFEAVTPDDLSNDKYKILKFSRKQSVRTKKSVRFTETEIAVWYSHFSTWKLCSEMNKSIIVAEHDIKLLQPVEDEVYNYDVACLAHVTRRKSTEIVKLGGGAYHITPKGANELLTIVKERKIIKNSDAWIHSKCDKFGKWFHHHSIQIKDDAIGVTVTHNK